MPDGGCGTTTITVEKEAVWHYSGTSADYCIIIELVMITLQEGAISAVPMASSAAVGETVTVLVVTGSFPSDAAFACMSGVAATVEDSGDFVDDTFIVGYLFNFGISFSQVGTYNLGFLEFQDVKRTYYIDAVGVEYNWMDLSNNIPDVTTSITVTE